MISLKFKFWNLDFLEIDMERDVPYAPQKGDLILFNDKWYEVESRGLDFDTGMYSKIHCHEKKNQ